MPNAVWTYKWLEEQSWRDIQRMRQLFAANPPTDSLGRQRRRRLEAEWDRRKKKKPEPLDNNERTEGL